MGCGGCKRKREDFRKKIEEESRNRAIRPLPPPTIPIVVKKKRGKSKRAIWLRAKRIAERRAARLAKRRFPPIPVHTILPTPNNKPV